MVLQFSFELASACSYPAAMRIEALAATRGAALAWRPFLLGPIFRDPGWSDSPFNLYPAKGRTMWRDLERICRGEGIPFRNLGVFGAPSFVADGERFLGNDSLEAALDWSASQTDGS